MFSKLCVLSQMNVTGSYNAVSHPLHPSEAESTSAVWFLCRADSGCAALHGQNWLLKGAERFGIHCVMGSLFQDY